MENRYIYIYNWVSLYLTNSKDQFWEGIKIYIVGKKKIYSTWETNII